jgi:hypothetical protein
MDLYVCVATDYENMSLEMPCIYVCMSASLVPESWTDLIHIGVQEFIHHRLMPTESEHSISKWAPEHKMMIFSKQLKVF